MPLCDHIRRWLRDHRDTPLTLTPEQAREFGIDQPAPVWLPGYGADLTDPEEDGELVTATIHRNRATGEVTLVVNERHAWDPNEEPYVWALTNATVRPMDEDTLVDAGPRDPRPDYCWRCDALPATDPIIGLCGKCHPELTGRD